MTGRKYLVAIALVWILIASWGVYLALENTRLTWAEGLHQQEMAERGVAIFANNCVVCHGPAGEGVVGPALNRASFRGDPGEDQEIFDFLYNTISQGRPGTAVPRWERLPSGEWVSFTAMPTFGVQHGGPLNEQDLRAVVTFLMAGNWGDVGRHIPPPDIPQGEELYRRLPEAAGLTPEENRLGQRLFAERGCITCHSIGGVGAHVGPDLSQVGQWGLDREFLINWIRDPQNTQHRAPEYWSSFQRPLEVAEALRAEGTEEVRELLGDPLPLGPSQMPPLPMTDQEREALVRYLSNLGR